MATPSPPSRRRKPQTLASVSGILAVLLVISVAPVASHKQVVSYETITVVNEFPHDPQAFTEVFSIFFFFLFCCCSCILCI
jgi:succinate dehydrogenase hydrophobic anchor subunit